MRFLKDIVFLPKLVPKWYQFGSNLVPVLMTTSLQPGRVSEKDCTRIQGLGKRLRGV